MEVNKFISKYRFLFFITCILIFIVLLIFQFAKYMVFREPEITKPKIVTERGSIYDRNRKILAVQATFYNLYADKSLIKNIAETAAELTSVLQMPESELLEKMQNSKSNFLYLKKRITESEKEAVKAVIDAKNLSGINLESVCVHRCRFFRR